MSRAERALGTLEELLRREMERYDAVDRSKMRDRISRVQILLFMLGADRFSWDLVPSQVKGYYSTTLTPSVVGGCFKSVLRERREEALAALAVLRDALGLSPP